MKNIFTSLYVPLVVCAIFCLQHTVSFAQCESLTATVSSNESKCAATGSIVINASGGLAPQNYQYSISAGTVTTAFSSLNTITGLPPGTYTVTIKDVTANCTITKPNIVVTGNYISPGVQYNSTKPTCMNGNDGTIFVTSQTGGRAPFSYQIITPSPSKVGTLSSTGSFTGLISGLYYIQMTDSCGGIQTRSQLVQDYSWSILGSSNVTNDCKDITANIFLTNSNGINSPDAAYAGFQYGISRFAGDTTWFASTPFNFNIGSYKKANIVVKDNCGNVQFFSWTMPVPKVNATVSTSNRSCSTFTATVTGQNNINVLFTQYCLYNQANTTIVQPCQSSPVFNNIPYGTYKIRVIESCYDTTITRTVSATKPVLSVNTTPQYSYDCGSYTASITGQTNITNAIYCLYRNGNIVADSCNITGSFDNLIYGDAYCIVMHNDDPCFDTTITRCFTINKQKPSVKGTVNISNNGCTTFTAAISNQNNLDNEIYQLFDGTNNTQIGPDQTSPVFNLLPYGSYCIRVINDAACYDTTIVRCFSESPELMKISLSARGSCNILGTTNIKVNYTTGIAPFTSKIYSPSGALLNTKTSSGSSYTFNDMPDLPSGDMYKVITTDACGRQDSGTVASGIYFINRNSSITPRCPSGTSPNGTSDVTMVVTENIGSTFTTTIIKKNGVTFNQNPDTKVSVNKTHTSTFYSLVPATYIFDTYSSSCSNHVYDTVVVAPYVYPSLSNSTGYICDNSFQSISSVTNGGIPPFQYQVFGSIPASPGINTAYQSSPIFNINNGTGYSLIRLRVIDACVNASINDVGFISVATPAIQVSNICLNSPTLLSVDAIPNATYQWFKRSYNPVDSLLIDSGNVLNLHALNIADTGTYITKTIINDGCEVRVSYVTLIPGTVTCMLLPTNIENFTAVKDNDHALLNWTISNELNIKTFTVERSCDNGITWQSIGGINSSGQTNYFFIDENPKTGINVYRLLMTNYNGSIAYSTIARVAFDGKKLITVYPNPVLNKEAIHIRFSGLTAGIYSMHIISSSGQTIKKMNCTMNNTGSRLVTIPSTNMASGLYKVIVQGKNMQYSKLIVVENSK